MGETMSNTDIHLTTLSPNHVISIIAWFLPDFLVVIFNCLQKVLQKRKPSVLDTNARREVYVSASNKMEVRLVVKRPDLLGYFLLKYEGKDYDFIF